MASTRFELKYEDVQRLQQAIINYGDGAERVINDYLSATANDIFRQSITNLIPVSNRDKQHARTSNPLIGEMSNELTLYIHTKPKFHYLYFPQMGEGTSKGKQPNDFMEKGLEERYDEVVNGLLEALQNNLNL